jgi:hypothetical protein
VGDWLQVVWSRRPRIIMRKQGMPVIDALEGHLTMDARSMSHVINSDPVVTPGGDFIITYSTEYSL